MGNSEGISGFGSEAEKGNDQIAAQRGYDGEGRLRQMLHQSGHRDVADDLTRELAQRRSA